VKPKRRQSNLDFRLMSLEYRIRDALYPPVKILQEQEAEVRFVMTVLDFGCRPGSFPWRFPSWSARKVVYKLWMTIRSPWDPFEGT
jgi:hypothetical protein